MEQAAALPFATRHLADLGADVIRVQSHQRPAPDSYDIELTRNKRQLAIDLAAPGGPEVFRRVAAACDVVCHNFTPQVVRKFGIDYESLRTLRPDLIYLELTGFGTDGPWRSRPLFGPGAEAVAGHNLLIGDPGQWPGRPPTITLRRQQLRPVRRAGRDRRAGPKRPAGHRLAPGHLPVRNGRLPARDRAGRARPGRGARAEPERRRGVRGPGVLPERRARPLRRGVRSARRAGRRPRPPWAPRPRRGRRRGRSGRRPRGPARRGRGGGPAGGRDPGRRGRRRRRPHHG